MIKENLKNVRAQIQSAVHTSPYHQNVTLLAVSKTHSVEDIMQAYEEGQRDFGENKVQELIQKADQLPSDIRWHMIGHLQTNKVRSVLPRACMIHSVDSLHLAEIIDKEAEKAGMIMPILIEVNIGEEKSKSGISPSQLPALVIEASRLENIRIKGLMCIPPVCMEEEDNRKYFRALRHLSIDIKQRNIDNISMDVLSMGMSDDYVAAISEGATIVRVGTGIFGFRNYSGNK